MPCAGANSSREIRLRKSGGTSSTTFATLPAASGVTGARANNSPVGPSATTSPLRRLGAGTAVSCASSLGVPGSPSCSTIGRSAAGSPCTVTGPSRCRLSAKRAAAAWAGWLSDSPSLSQTTVARSSPVVCSSAACAAARSTGHGRGCQPGRASSAAPAVSRCTAIPPSTPIGGGAVSSSSTSRPSRWACCRRSRAMAIRWSQCLAAAQPSSTTSSSGPLPPKRGAGLSKGPARARISRAAKARRNSSSHHGVRAGVRSRLINPARN